MNYQKQAEVILDKNKVKEQREFEFLAK